MALTLPHAKHITAVGSRVTCDPPPTDTDCDWLVLVEADMFSTFFCALMNDGWELGGSEIPADANTLEPDAQFASFTKGEDNVIATSSENFHKRFLAATSVAKRLNLRDKLDRIALFQAVLYAAVNPPAVFEPVTVEELAIF